MTAVVATAVSSSLDALSEPIHQPTAHRDVSYLQSIMQ